MKKIYLFILLLPFIGLGQNYIKNRIYRDTITGPAQPSTINITFFDGLGRPIQKKAHAQSAGGYDIVTPIVYDDFGRQVKDYLPYPAQGASLAYENGADAAANTHYAAEFPAEGGLAYAERELEASPLGRVLKQGAPGTPWGINTAGSDHAIKFEQSTNKETLPERIPYYKATATYDPVGQLYTVAYDEPSFYSKEELYKMVTKDENWTSGTYHTTEEYKDRQGRVVLKRTYGESMGISYDTQHDTRYVYDQFGNLTLVLPPMATNAVEEVRDNLGYQYWYDKRNRLVEKKLPGKTKEYIVYDSLDRVIAVGPAPSPFRDGTGTGWIITYYDAKSRVAFTGWEEQTEGDINTPARVALQNDNNGSVPLITTGRPSTIDNVEIFYEVSPAVSSRFKLLTVNYYDNYRFWNRPLPSIVEGTPVISASTSITTKDLPTGSWVRVLVGENDAPAEVYITLYDNKSRPISTHNYNYEGGVTITDSKLRFTGLPDYTVTSHVATSNALNLVTVNNYTYTDQDRIDTHTHEILGVKPPELMSKNTYYPLGELKSKKVGGTDVSGASFHQNVRYKYNIRGWLTDINGAEEILPESPPAEFPDLFVFNIKYNDPLNEIGPLYNGNISETHWKSESDGHQRSYVYGYDSMNRLRWSRYLRNNIFTNAYNESMQYDRNGNISSLTRNGMTDDPVEAIEIDDLQYGYPSNSNRLYSVTDHSASPEGFRDGASRTQEYYYDAYGNMIRDENKGINEITYNHLHLPVKITFTDATTIDYLYNAMGVKLEKTINGTNTTQYRQGYQYYNSRLQHFATAEGYVDCTNHTDGKRTYNYVYQYKDHLGNIRLTYGLKNAVSNKVEIMNEQHYYPFGLQHQNYNTENLVYQEGEQRMVMLGEKEPMPIDPHPTRYKPPYNYKYNGKEWQDELGLNMYDYGARNYDPALGRWMNVDPLAERRNQWAPYVYCLNNPILRYDPNGLTDFIINKKTGTVEQIGEQNDDPDRILKSNRKGKVKYRRNGEAKVAIDDIEKGILENGQNFKNEDEIISVGGANQPSVAGVKSFTLKLSLYLGKELKGFSYSSSGSGNITDVLLTKYLKNLSKKSYGRVTELQKKYGNAFSFNNLVQQFHTHPDGELGATQSNPEISQDVKALQSDKRHVPNASFIILYQLNGQTSPAEYDYTHEYRPK